MGPHFDFLLKIWGLINLNPTPTIREFIIVFVNKGYYVRLWLVMSYSKIPEILVDDEREQKRVCGGGGVIFYLLLFVFAAAASFALIQLNPRAAFSFSSKLIQETFSFSIHRDNYDTLSFFTQDDSNVVTYKILSDFDGIFEPYVHNVIELVGASTYYTYQYSVKNLNNDDDTIEGTFDVSDDGESTTADFKVKCDPFDEYSISIDEYTPLGEINSSITGSALCLYVRREIRQLTDNDLSTTMDAMYTLWSGISDEYGQETYGENFHNSTYLASMHYFGSSQRDSDHFHEGLGFLPHHMYMTYLFELSIQAVNPEVTCPYWDSTIDDEQEETDKDYFIFQENTFGSLNFGAGDGYSEWNYKTNKVDDARIRDGRWVNQTTEYNTFYPEMRQGYGYLRGPWNMNPSPYLVRFPKGLSFTGCSTNIAGLSKNFKDFLGWSMSAPHGSFHVDIGGSFGCDTTLDSLYDSGLLLKKSSIMCLVWGGAVKDFWRDYYITPLSSCEVNIADSSLSSCGFTCDESLSTEFIVNIKRKFNDYFKDDRDLPNTLNAKSSIKGGPVVPVVVVVAAEGVAILVDLEATSDEKTGDKESTEAAIQSSHWPRLVKASQPTVVAVEVAVSKVVVAVETEVEVTVETEEVEVTEGASL